jgi:hypothetical protein
VESGLVGKDLKGNGRVLSDGIIATYFKRKQGKAQKMRGRIAGNMAEIRTWHFPNEC